MTSTTVPVTAPADDRLGRLIDAVGQLAQQQRSLLDALRPAAVSSSQPSLTPPAATQPYAVAPPATSPITPPPPAVPDIRSLVADLFRQQVTAAQQSAVRDAYLKQHLSDLPEAYRRLMPDTADITALATAEQTVRQQYRDDLKSTRRTGAAAVPTGATADLDATGRSPADVLDYGKLSPMQQIALGLKSSRPPTGRPAGPVGIATLTGRDSSDAADDADDAGDMLDDQPLFVGAD